MERIVVQPFGPGWSVTPPGAANAMIFRSGRVAEETARSLALRLARTGATAELELRLRLGGLGARYVCVPPVSDDDDVLMLALPGLGQQASG